MANTTNGKRAAFFCRRYAPHAQGWTGFDCSEPVCPIPCQHQGNCTLPDVCTCAPGWTGDYCEEALCAQASSPSDSWTEMERVFAYAKRMEKWGGI